VDIEADEALLMLMIWFDFVASQLSCASVRKHHLRMFSSLACMMSAFQQDKRDCIATVTSDA